MRDSTAILVPRHPWPLPSAIGAACGIWLAGTGLPWWLLLGHLPLIWWARPLLLAFAGREAGRSRGHLSKRALVALFVPLLAALVGYGRYGHWESRPDPVVGHMGRRLQLSGVSDGRILSVREPLSGRLAIAPTGSVPPGRVELLGTISEPDSRRNPGGFDYRAYLERRGVHAQVLVEEVIDFEPRNGLLDRLRRGVRAGLPPPSAALMEAMTLGVRDELGELREVFAAAGLAHVLALSGLHVGLLMAALGWLLRPLGLARYPLLITADFAYMYLVGATPSVVRAALMVAVVLVALWLGAGRIQPWPALGLAALATLLVRPAWLFDLSLQLSYGAVSGILLFTLPLGAFLRGVPPLPWWHPRLLLLAPLLTSASAQLPTLPLVASAFGTVPLLSPLVNLLALPLASLLVPLGFAAGLLGLISHTLALLLNQLTEPLSTALLTIAGIGSHLPSVTWGEVEPVGYLYFALAVAALALAAHGLLRIWRALLLVALTMLLSAATPSRHPPAELVVFDVGQGDSVLLRLPGRVEVLVDGGGSPFSDWDVGAGTVLPALRALGVDELELVVATHADLDHMEGLVTLVDEFPVQLLLLGHGEQERPLYRRLVEAAGENGIPVREVRRGERVRLGGATLEILNPAVPSYGKSNDDSVGLAVYWKGMARALLLGDISTRVEEDLVVPPVEVLLAPHHGSASSSSPRLLAAARPREVVISVGRNGYGHPSPQVLERIEEHGASVRITREEGAVRIPLGR